MPLVLIPWLSSFTGLSCWQWGRREEWVVLRCYEFWGELWVLRWVGSSEVSCEFWGEWVVLRWPMRGRVPERHRSLHGVSFLLMVLTTPWALHCETQSSSQYLPWPVQKEKLLKKQLVWRLSFMSWDFTKCITKFQSWQLTLTPVTLLTLLI